MSGNGELFSKRARTADVIRRRVVTLSESALYLFVHCLSAHTAGVPSEQRWTLVAGVAGELLAAHCPDPSFRGLSGTHLSLSRHQGRGPETWLPGPLVLLLTRPRGLAPGPSRLGVEPQIFTSQDGVLSPTRRSARRGQGRGGSHRFIAHSTGVMGV